MYQRRDKIKVLHGWFLMTSVCHMLITRVDAAHFDPELIEIRDVDAQAASYKASDVVQYVLFHSGMGDVVYNQARATCKAIGGDLAKVETVEKRDWINSLNQTADPVIDQDIWVGLTESVAGSPTWAQGCQPANVTLVPGDTWDPNLLCFRLHSSSGKFEFDRRACDAKFDFLCETYTAVTKGACDVHPTYNDSKIPDDDCDQTTTSTTTTVSITTTTPTTTTTTTPTTTTTSTTTASTTTPASTSTTTPSTTTTTQSSTTTTTALSTTSTTLTTSTPITTTTTPTTTSTTTQTITTTPSTSPSSSTTAVDDCGDCFCVLTANITTQEAQAIADRISKNLTVDAKSTSAYRRKLESAEDNRPSAKAVGFVGIIFIIIPFGGLILTDVRTMIQGFVNIRNVYKI